VTTHDPAWRRALLARHPRIEYQTMTQTCDGYRWSRMPLKAIWADVRGYDPSLKERHRCRNAAHWVFRALKPRGKYDFPAHDGVYCMSHLFSQLHSPSEWDRFCDWVDRQLVLEERRSEAT
jgi:hypothetical protein